MVKKQFNCNNGFNKVLFIQGATASGKSSLSYSLANTLRSRFSLDCAIISADSRQIYRGLDIGTATPSPEQRNSLPHYLINTKNPDEAYSAASFVEDAFEYIQLCTAQNIIPIVVGGTGFYITALVNGLGDATLSIDEQQVYNETYKQLELEILVNKEHVANQLFTSDPDCKQLYHDLNPRKILRALSFTIATGRHFSSITTQTIHKNTLDILSFAVERQRELLYEYINSRTLDMWKNGIVDETENLLQLGYTADTIGLKTVGYKDAIEYLRNRCSFDEGIERTALDTRRYAKRQMTWLRNKSIPYESLNGNNEEMIEIIIQKMFTIWKI